MTMRGKEKSVKEGKNEEESQKKIKQRIRGERGGYKQRVKNIKKKKD